jgi:hypothetical protein
MPKPALEDFLSWFCRLPVWVYVVLLVLTSGATIALGYWTGEALG